MFYIYFLKSLRNGDLYVGSCKDTRVRVARHNRGLVRSTKANRPWKLLGFEKALTRSDAVKREMFLKTGQQKELLKMKYRDL